ncbi:MAG: fatty acid desaturase [Synechococcaceae cyanobacterium]|nr:fatty acid desaturase [Synechococcaceae cyanobacterium]
MRGLWSAAAITVLWAASGALWWRDVSAWPPLLLIPVLLVRAYLQTGLFIVAHDAMHGSLLPGDRHWNDRLGRLVLWLYACLPWEHCRRNHHRHHRHPASRRDPDHHGRSPHGVVWYVRFMAAYLGPVQLALLIGAWLGGLLLASGVTPHPLANLLLVGVLPLWLSSLQLFVFGTYLPHRQTRGGDRHQATTLFLPPAISLLACYHFGYHWEHHDAPDLPWFALPQRHRTITDRPPPRPWLALPEVSR